LLGVCDLGDHRSHALHICLVARLRIVLARRTLRIACRVYEVLPQERAAICEFALQYPKIGYRKLTWMMVDAGVACVGDSTVYRLLSDADPLSRWMRSTVLSGGYKFSWRRAHVALGNDSGGFFRSQLAQKDSSVIRCFARRFDIKPERSSERIRKLSAGMEKEYTMFRKSANICAVGLVCALVVSPVAFSGSATYDYSGVVTSVDDSIPGNSIAIGSKVTGTYTFDFANANPALSSGVVGSANWIVASQGDSVPTPTLLVFTSTAQASGFNYATPPPVNTGFPGSGGQSSVQGSANSGPGSGSSFTAGEAWEAVPDINGGSSLTISNPHGAYSFNGLPILAGATSATGQVSEFLADTYTSIDFKITSLTPAVSTSAPEIDGSSAVVGITLLIGGLTVLRGRRRGDMSYMPTR
jgi:hypothetical protein